MRSAYILLQSVRSAINCHKSSNISSKFNPLVASRVFSRDFLRVRYKNATSKEDTLEDDDIDVDDDFDDIIVVNSAQRRQAERLWHEILPLTTTLNIGPVVKLWLRHDRHLGFPGVLYVIAKLRTFKRFKQALSILDWLSEEKPFGEFNEHLHRLHVWVACEAHALRRAEQVFQSTPPELQTQRLKAALAAGYAFRNNSCKAEDMLRKYSISTVEPYTALLRLYFRIGVHDKAAELYREMKSLNIQPNLAAYTALLRQRDNMGKIECLEEDAEEALKAAGAYEEDLKLKRSAANYAMVILAYLGKLADVIRMWNHIRTQETISVDSYIDAIDAFGALGKVRMAEKVADEMEMTKKSYIRLSSAMIHLYTRNGMIDKAENVLQDLRENGVYNVFRPTAELILGYLANGLHDKAMVALKKALLVKLMKPSYDIILKMLPVYEKKRDAEGAEEMVDRYRGITDIRLYKGLLKVYIASRVKPLEDVEARLVLRRITPDEETLELLNKLKKIVG